MNANQIVLNDFINKHPFAAAQSLELLSSEAVASFLQTISLEKSKKLFSLMKIEKAAAVLVLLPNNKGKELIENVDTSYIASVLKSIDTPIRNKLLDNLTLNKQAIIKRQLAFLPNTVASIMEDAMVVTKEMAVDHVLETIKRSEEKEEFYLYVVDVEGAFEGIVRLKELVLARKADTLEDLMIKGMPDFLSDIPIKSILEHPAWLEFQELPVLDKSGKLLGRLPHRNTLKFTHKPNNNSSKEIAKAGSALGELYRIGLTGLLQDGGK